MWRSSIFYKFFKYRKNSSHEIIKYTSNKKLNLQEQINDEIREIDEKISENSKALVEAQIVKFRSTFSKSNNLIERISQNVYKKKVEESINWHQKALKELYFRRKGLQINLEKIKGVYWQNQIKRLLTIVFIGLFILFIIFIFLSGFIIIIYFLPLIILVSIGYLLLTKKR